MFSFSRKWKKSVEPEVTMEGLGREGEDRHRERERSKIFKINLMNKGGFCFISVAFPQWPQLLLHQFPNPTTHPCRIPVWGLRDFVVSLCHGHESYLCNSTASTLSTGVGCYSVVYSPQLDIPGNTAGSVWCHFLQIGFPDCPSL